MSFDPLKINIVITSFKIISLIVGCLIFFSSWYIENKMGGTGPIVFVFFFVGLILIVTSTVLIVKTLIKWN